jgi:hypothetical protein
MSATVTLLDHHGDALSERRTVDIAGGEGEGGGEPSVLAFTLPPDVLTAAHGIEGMHLQVASPDRWDYVSGVNVYHGGPGASGWASPFDVAFGSLAAPTSSAPQ